MCLQPGHDAWGEHGRLSGSLWGGRELLWAFQASEEMVFEKRARQKLSL